MMKKDNFTLTIIYINVALYATCYQLQRPLEPFLVAKLFNGGDSSDEYAKLQSFFSIMQTFGSLLAGWFLDKCGTKGGFFINFLSSALSYYLLSQSTTLEILYISKIPTIFQAGFLCAQVAASQVTSDGSDRVAALGKLTMSYTVGMVVGPAIGGYLGATGDYYYGAKLAVCGSLLSAFLTLFMPKSIEVVTNKDDNIEKFKDNSKNYTGGISGVISVTWILLSTKIISGFANSMSSSAFPLILKNNYNLNEKHLGLSMSLMSGFNAVVNGLLLGPLVKYAGGELSIVIGVCIVGMFIFFSLQSVFALPMIGEIFPILLGIGGVLSYLITSVFLNVFQYVLSTSITADSTARVHPNAKGTLLGLEHSLFAAVRIITPQAGVGILQNGGVSAVSASCGAIYCFITLYWGLFSGRLKSIKSNVIDNIEANDESKKK
jgi:OCT family organic cation transporter-like MFS transporter 18